MKKRILAVVLTVALLCGVLPSALSVTAVAEPTVTTVTESENAEWIIAPAENILTAAKSVTYTKGDGGTNANGWNDTSTLTIVGDISAVAYDGVIAPTGDTWRVRDGFTGEIWLQYDFGIEYKFDRFFCRAVRRGVTVFLGLTYLLVTLRIPRCRMRRLCTPTIP